jgi:hypothetical protein
VKMSERDTNTEEKHKEPRAWRPWIPLRRQPWRWVLWAVMLVIALVALGWLVDNLYPGIWQEISGKRVATLIGIGVALTVIIVLLAKGSASLGWTGFRGKTLWDLLQLLIVPLVLVGIGLLFEMQQAARQEALEHQQLALEDRRARAERELAEERAQDEALQAYLDQMSDLLLAKDGLRESEEGSEVRTLARARTITVLGRLEDPSRKRAIMAFLVETELVQRVEGRAPIIHLSFADLSGAPLFGADLRGANLYRADLRGANLSDAVLSEADLWQADLSGIDLDNADLSDAVLSEADLRGANLRGANLSRTDLSGAEGVTNEKLEQQAKTLNGATMPDGTVLPERYATREFEPALSLSLSGDGWQLYSETPDLLSFEGPDGGLHFNSPLYVLDPSNPSEPKEVPAPENTDEWVSWFRTHPNRTPRNRSR